MKKLILTTIAAVALSFNANASVTTSECVALGELASTAVELRQQGKSKIMLLDAIRATNAEVQFKEIGYMAVDVAFDYPILDSAEAQKQLGKNVMLQVIKTCMGQ
tara:strand:+ start:27736 stop:28050 length:315 start_codon:yes stop_codon:yes gene_type:complete